MVQFFGKSQHIELINRLKKAGVQLEILTEAALSNRLEGKRIVVSGVFERFGRDELKTLIEQHGGTNVSSVSAKTDFVLAGEGMGPSKFAKAEKLGVAIVTEDEFVKMLEA